MTCVETISTRKVRHEWLRLKLRGTCAAACELGSPRPRARENNARPRARHRERKIKLVNQLREIRPVFRRGSSASLVLLPSTRSAFQSTLLGASPSESPPICPSLALCLCLCLCFSLSCNFRGRGAGADAAAAGEAGGVSGRRPLQTRAATYRQLERARCEGEMEEEEDGGDLLAALSLNGRGSSRYGGTVVSNTMPAPTPPPGHQRNKVMSYSQPLPRDGDGGSSVLLGGGNRRGAARRNSLEEERIPKSRSSSDNEYSTADDWDDDYGGGPDGLGNPYFSHNQQLRFYQSLSCPDETARNHYPRHHHPQQGHHLPPSSYHQYGGGAFLGSVRFGDTSSSLGWRTSTGGSSGSFSPPKMAAGVGVGTALPEFTGAGGGQGIFKLPLRAPVHPGRPPSLDLRPHPLRETQAGSFLRTVACTPTQLWAGQESGVRFWNFSDLYGGLEGEGRILVRGDEESAPFRMSYQTSPTLCMVVDVATHLIWTGHKDGKIRSWRMDQPLYQTSASFDSSIPSSTGSSGSSQHIRSFKEGLAWQAHRSPVLSLIITSYGNKHYEHFLHHLIQNLQALSYFIFLMHIALVILSI